MKYTKVKSGKNKGLYKDDSGKFYTPEEIADKKVIEVLRPDREIRAKVRICFGDGIYRSPNEIKKIKKNKLNKLKDVE